MRWFEKCVLCSISFVMVACSGGGGKASSSTSSGASSSAAVASHNPGLNCMNCHDGDSEAPRFTVAGTVYKSGGSQPQTAATIRLYIHNTSTISAELFSDALGNFYTTAAVEGLSDGSGAFVTGVDVEIEGPGGALRQMPGQLSSTAACNVCHGDTVGRIIAD